MAEADDVTRRITGEGETPTEPVLEPTRVFETAADQVTEVIPTSQTQPLPTLDPQAAYWGPPSAHERVEGPVPGFPPTGAQPSGYQPTAYQQAGYQPNAYQPTAYPPTVPYPGGSYQAGPSPVGSYQNGSYQNGSYQNGGYPGGHPQAGTQPWAASQAQQATGYPPQGQPGYPGATQPGYPGAGQQGYPGAGQQGYPGTGSYGANPGQYYASPGQYQANPGQYGANTGPYYANGQPGTPPAGYQGYSHPGSQQQLQSGPYANGYATPPTAQPTRRSGRRGMALAAFVAVAALGWASFSWAANPLSIDSLLPTESDTTTEPTIPTRPERPGGQDRRTDTSGSTDTTVTAALSNGVALIAAETSSGAAAGTGMVISSDGRVLTNYHVVAGSLAVKVTIVDSGSTYSASVIGFDQSSDVALLQLKNASGLDTVIYDDDSVAIGDDVSAVGNAKGGGVLVRAPGQVTGLEENLTVSSDSPWGSSEDLEGLIQTTAGAVPGHSGGPMFDEEAEVVGITTAGSVEANTSYAVPIADALAIVNQIESGSEVGTVRIGPAGYLGIAVADDERGANGVTITEVTEGSPADDAGVKAGSVLTRVGDTAITANTNVATVIRSLEPGQQVTIGWVAPNGSQKQATVTMGTSPVN